MTNWLLLHGTPLTPAVWDGLRPMLTGHVEAPNVTPGPDDLQRTIAGRLSADGAHGPWHVVGHSFGGQVALELAIRSPELVSRLTLLCTRDTPYPPFAAAADRAPDDEVTLRRWFGAAERIADGPAFRYARTALRNADRAAWSRALAAIATFDCSAQTSSIRCPTTVVAAGHDAVSTPAAMSEMCSRLPAGRVVVLDDAWHMSIFTDPAKLAALL